MYRKLNDIYYFFLKINDKEEERSYPGSPSIAASTTEADQLPEKAENLLTHLAGLLSPKKNHFTIMKNQQQHALSSVINHR